ncbi:hypothetical protein DXG03_004479 [Asterophora parasitica]|uniref:BAG domain-containing protein n=1 Tax=Asterophora parasitica TaxID=117018 RepID=A0A9P7GA42_9AGAR|nr:hypothetical protein DXG03_004479 [Asterophora parasitica]
MMPYYAPASRLSSSFPYPQAPLNNPRDRYLAALAEAKAAEAEYLAAEAVQREEEALRRRLEEIQLRKQEENLYLRSRCGRTPYALDLQAPTPISRYGGTYPSYGHDNLVNLSHQVEKEERLRFLVLKVEAEAEVRRQAEELRRKRQEKAALLLQQEREQAHVAAFLERHAAKVRQSPGHQPHRHRQVPNQPFRQPLVLHPSLLALLGSYAVTATNGPAPVKPVCPRLHPTLVSGANVPPQTPAQPSFEKEGEVINELLGQLLGVQPTSRAPAPAPVAAPTPVQPAAAKPELPLAEGTYNFLLGGNPQKADLAPFINLFNHHLDQNETSKSDQVAPEDRVSLDGAAMLQQFVDLFTPPAPPTARQQSNAQASGSGSSPKPSSSTASPIVTPAPSVPKSSPFTEETLKQQLEARLNNEYSSEVRDTIQAIIASLQDSSTTSSPTSTKAESSKGKGKGKAIEAPGDAPTAAPTSKDLLNSMNDVRSIDAAFQALSADFTFPSTLDFLAAHIVPGSPAFSGSESSATVHLAYTSRNHPVRFYEQALSALLTQLDAVQSFGNDDLRNMRREVVSRVERALEELEAEVDGRWRTRLSKEAKAVKIEVTDPVATPEPVATTVSKPVPSAETVPATTTPESKAEIPEEPAAPVDETSTPSPTPEATTTPESKAEVTEEPVAPVDETSASSPTAEATTAAPESTSDSAAAAAYTPPSSEVSSLADSEISITTAKTSTTDATTHASTSLAASVATIKGYDVEYPADDASDSTESGDEFLLAATDDVPKRPNSKDNEDAGSDWSEVEA